MTKMLPAIMAIAIIPAILYGNSFALCESDVSCKNDKTSNHATKSSERGQLIATINGVSVYSNKKLTSINDTRVAFSDGSWCDIATGEVTNKGPGYINIETRASKAGDEKRIETDVFSGHKLEMRDLTADIDIQPYNGTKIEVTREGPGSMVDEIRAYVSGDRIIVGNEGQDTPAHIQIGRVRVSGSGTSIITGSNVIVIGRGKDAGIETKVRVKVPRGFPISIYDINGSAVIGDTEGPFRCHTNTGGHIVAGSVGDTTIVVQGSADVRVRNVRDNLRINVQGSGSVKVEKGNINILGITIQGSGDVIYGGDAVDADLSTSGSGDISVHHVTNRPMINIMGSGDVTVGNW